MLERNGRPSLTSMSLNARFELMVVALTCSAMIANAVRVVWRFGSRMPYYDDWYVLSGFATSCPGDWSWLFAQHHGHIFPFGRLAFAASWLYTDGNLRPILFSSTFFLSIATVFSLVVLNRLRNATRLEDVAVPLALLGSHCYNDLLWAIMWPSILAGSLLCLVTGTLVLISDRPRPMLFVAVLISVAFLSYQSASGLLYTIGLIPAIVFVGSRIVRGNLSRSVLALVAAATLFTAIAVGIVLLYEVHLVSSGEAVLRSRGRTGIAFFNLMAHGFGELANPYLGACDLIMPLVLLVTVGFGVSRSNRQNPRAITTVLLILPVLVLCAGIAGSRSVAFLSRYVGMVMPIWFSLAIAAITVKSHGVLRPLILSSSLLLAVSSGMSLHSHVALGVERLAADRRLEKSISAGHSAERLAADLSAAYKVFSPDLFAKQLLEIKSLRRGSLSRIQDSTELVWCSISPIPDHTRNCLSEGDSWFLSEGSRMYFSVSGDGGPVDAVRIKFDYVGMWSVTVAGGPSPQQNQEFLGVDLDTRQLHPVGKATSAEGESYTTIFAFDRPADGFVFGPPTGRGSIRILSLEVGRTPPTMSNPTPAAAQTDAVPARKGLGRAPRQGTLDKEELAVARGELTKRIIEGIPMGDAPTKPIDPVDRKKQAEEPAPR
jgi:hypothetical protein